MTLACEGSIQNMLYPFRHRFQQGNKTSLGFTAYFMKETNGFKAMFMQ